MFGLFKRYDVHLCPDVSGVVLYQGQPVEGLTITRSLTYYYGKEQLDHTVTDAEGRFSFPEVNIRSSKPGSMFDVSRTYQEIKTNYENQEHRLWFSVFHGIENRAEYVEKLTTLTCELTNEAVKFSFENRHNPHLRFTAISNSVWEKDYRVTVRLD